MIYGQFIFGFLGGIGVPEILLIVLAILILFGAKKIPEFAKGLGQGIREFKNATNNVKGEIQKEIDAAHAANGQESEANKKANKPS
jgi:sec-independent protein translocase protein TatA